MARFDAYDSGFDIKNDVNFYWYVRTYSDETLARNENTKVHGVTYKDWLTINGFYGDDSDYFDYYFYFAGSRITGSALENTVSGTVNFFAENWMSDTGELFYWYSLGGVSLSARSILDAARTQSTTDDLALFKTSLQGNDTIIMSNFNDRMNGFSGNDTMQGNNGSDALYGDAGADKITGGTGRDHLYGGTGADDFVFNDGEMGNSASTRDVIYDFSTRSDDLDLRLIDANSRRAGDQNFDFGGTRAGANYVWFARSGNNVIVFGDTNGDARADFARELRGVSSLTAGDFLL